MAQITVEVTHSRSVAGPAESTWLDVNLRPVSSDNGFIVRRIFVIDPSHVADFTNGAQFTIDLDVPVETPGAGQINASVKNTAPILSSVAMAAGLRINCAVETEIVSGTEFVARELFILDGSIIADYGVATRFSLSLAAVVP